MGLEVFGLFFFKDEKGLSLGWRQLFPLVPALPPEGCAWHSGHGRGKASSDSRVEYRKVEGGKVLADLLALRLEVGAHPDKVVESALHGSALIAHRTELGQFRRAIASSSTGRVEEAGVFSAEAFRCSSGDIRVHFDQPLGEVLISCSRRPRGQN